MSGGYGMTFEQVKTVLRPAPCPEPWGELTVCAELPEYALHRLRMAPRLVMPLHFYARRRGVYYVQEGGLVLRRRRRSGEARASAVSVGDVVSIGPGEVHGFRALEESTLYLFTSGEEDPRVFVETQPEALAAPADGSATERDAASTGRTSDRRDKYWGAIETIADGEFAAKRISIRAGAQSSLEYHVRKTETYFVHSGRVKIGVRIGRGENRSVVVSAGERFDVSPGLMHMRIGLEDSVIMEISTPDSDADSYLVEDGQRYRHLEQ